MSYTYFSKELAIFSVYFEIGLFIFLLPIFAYGILRYRFFIWRFFALAFGIFCFEGLTGALWNNAHLGIYAYIHNDISWILTLTWASIIFFVRFVYDKCVQKKSLIKEFITIVLKSSILIGVVLVVLNAIGVFSYSSATTLLLAQKTHLIFGVPLEVILYIPIFVFSVYSFYKYWELAMYDKHLFSKYSIVPSKDIFIGSLVILLIGYLIHPLLNISSTASIFFLLGYMIGLILTNFIINSIKDAPLFQRYMGGVFVFSLYGMIFMDFMIKNNMLSFVQAVKDTYTEKTIQIPWFSFTDVEFVGMVLFSCLIIAMIKYFKIVTDTKKSIQLDDTKMTFQGWKSLFKN